MWAQRGSERGAAVLFVIAALALSAGVGIGVYFVIKQQREASESDRATSIRDEDEPTRRSAQPPDPVDPLPPEPVPQAEPAAPIDRAEAEAVDPEVASQPPATNAPRFGTPGVDGALDKQAVATVDGNPARIVYPIAFHNADGNDEGEVRAPSAPDAPSREELSTALRTLRSKVAACASAQGLTGAFKIRFKVLPSGTVSEVTVANAEPPFPSCVALAFKSYKFSASQNGVVASFPFNVQ